MRKMGVLNEASKKKKSASQAPAPPQQQTQYNKASSHSKNTNVGKDGVANHRRHANLSQERVPEGSGNKVIAVSS